MNKRIKKKWLAAMRSGLFTKITHKLRVKKTKAQLAENDNHPYNYCALGVLENIYCEETGAKFKDTGALSEGCVKWAGLGEGNNNVKFVNVEFVKGKSCYDVPDLNDSSYLSLPEIADVLDEKEL